MKAKHVVPRRQHPLQNFQLTISDGNVLGDPHQYILGKLCIVAH